MDGSLLFRVPFALLADRGRASRPVIFCSSSIQYDRSATCIITGSDGGHWPCLVLPGGSEAWQAVFI